MAAMALAMALLVVGCGCVALALAGRDSRSGAAGALRGVLGSALTGAESRATRWAAAAAAAAGRRQSKPKIN